MTDVTTPSFSRREVRGTPSSARSAFLKQRYLEAPLVVDVEYIRLLTQSHKGTRHMETLERRAENHAHALENLTPVIHPRDRLAGNKTRFIRGAVPYANYAAAPFLREIRKQQQDAQQKLTAQGTGGGIALAHEQAANEGMTVFSGKFLISHADLDELNSICEYWEDTCMMEAGNKLWRRGLPEAAFIESGWNIGLYTAPHDPCPEGRIALDFETALTKGYKAILQELDDKIAAFDPHTDDARKMHFWRAARRVLNGALCFAANYAARAEWLARSEEDAERRRELLDMADACRHVPALPPRTFREAVQSFWFTYVLGHLEGSHLGYSPGRLDQVLFPFFAQDAGTTYAQAVELLEELFVKMTQVEYVASLSWQGLGHGNLFQNCILGGLDAQGAPADNELSLAILDAQINMQMTQPTLSVWYDDSLSQKFLLKAIDCVKTGVGYPAFFNLKTYVAHECKTSGLPAEVIRRYAAMGGCTEPVLQGMSYGVVQPGFVNHGKLIDLTMNDGVDPITGTRLFDHRPVASYEDVEASFLEKMHAAVRNWQRYWNYVMVAHRQTVPLIFCSVFVRDCVQKGLCMDDGGAVLNQTPTTLSSGLVNVVNSLAVIRRLCYLDEVCTLDELRTALADNWQGHEMLRKKALAVSKWGNDHDEVDEIFLRLFDDYCRWVRDQDNYLGRPYDPSMLAISTPVPFGKACAAFPDGRLSGEPLADGVTSPFPGTDTHGPTAVVRSSGKVDHSRIRGGLLNLKFHPSALRGQAGSRNLLALIKTYFDMPGFHVQFNVVDSEMLKDAQVHPERYRDLVVRVAGFSAYWVEMSKALQDQVIWRTEHGM